MPHHPLTNFKIKKYYQNDRRFYGIYSRDTLPKRKDRVYIINFDEYSDTQTHWVALYAHNNDVASFDFFGVEHIPNEIKAFINRLLSITTNIFKIQAYDSIMCGYFCIGFIDFMFAGKTLTEYTNFFNQITLRKFII